MRSIIITIIAVVVLLGGGYFLFVSDNSQPTETGASQVGMSVGDTAPDFAIATLAGKEIKSDNLRGKVIVITSSAAWCPTCIMEAQEFAPVYKKYQDGPVAFITIDIDPRDDKAFIEQFKKDNDTPWDYADAEGGAELTKNYELSRFEITYVIDKDGIIRFKDSVITSSEKLDKEISPLL